MRNEPTTHNERIIARVFAETKQLEAELDAIKLYIMLKAGFNPNQPRVPAGNPDGGQWTDGGGSGYRRNRTSDKPQEHRLEGVPDFYDDAIEEVYPEAYIFGLLPVGSAIRNIFSGGRSVQEVIEWRLGDYKSPARWQNRINKGKWTEEEISETISKGIKTKADNRIKPKNTATQYYNPKTKKYVVRDDITGEIIQLSGPNHKPNTIPQKRN